MIDLNVLFELISLYHLLITEEKVTIHQLLFIKKHKGNELKAKNKIENQENFIKIAMNVVTVYVLIVKIYGCLPRFLVFNMYTKLSNTHHNEFEIELKLYTILVAVEEIIFLAIYIAVIPILFYKMYKVNKNEFRLHMTGILIYSMIVNISKFAHIEEFIFLYDAFNGHHTVGYDENKLIPEPIICFTVINIFNLIVPLVLVWYKRDEDIFMSFSKIDSLA